jgi:hypothetical protein
MTDSSEQAPHLVLASDRAAACPLCVQDAGATASRGVGFADEVALKDSQWQHLINARRAYKAAVSEHYDEVLHEVAQHAEACGSIGKSDIGALLLWKRLRADTPWAGELMALPDTTVRATTAAALATARDTALCRAHAAREGRAALTELPGFAHGDALASAVLTAGAPRRMAIYDRRVHAGLRALDLALSNAPGRYSRYMHLLDRLLAAGPHPVTALTARDLDTALYWLLTTPGPAADSSQIKQTFPE